MIKTKIIKFYMICIYLRWPSVSTSAPRATTAPMASNAPMASCALIETSFVQISSSRFDQLLHPPNEDWAGMDLHHHRSANL